MTKYAVLFLIIIWVSCNNSSPKQQTADISSEDSIISIIEFSGRTIDFGTLSNDTNVYAKFYLKNVGTEKLIIRDVSPECSCTGYKLDNDTIPQGDSTKLVVAFNTKGKGEGLQRKAIIINSNTEKEYNTLFIRCIIRNPNNISAN